MGAQPANDMRAADPDGNQSAGPDSRTEGTLRGAMALGATLFARKGEALPLVDKKGGAEAPEEVVAENRAIFAALGLGDPDAISKNQESSRASTESGVPGGAMTIINERSLEAGYPHNPTPEEIAAMEAEEARRRAQLMTETKTETKTETGSTLPNRPDAKEQVSPSANFIGEPVRDAPQEAVTKVLAKEPLAALLQGQEVADRPVEIQVREPDQPTALPTKSPARPPAQHSGLPVHSVAHGKATDQSAVDDRAVLTNTRATIGRPAFVTFGMAPAEFLRFKLGAAQLRLGDEELICAAIEAFLDANGVDSFERGSCLADAAEKYAEALKR